jgi:hypothetical protein
MRVTFRGGKEIITGFEFPHQKKKQMSRCRPTPMVAPLSHIAMTTSDMASNHGAATPHESVEGARWRVSNQRGWFLCLGCQNVTHQEIERWVGPRP